MTWRSISASGVPTGRRRQSPIDSTIFDTYWNSDVVRPIETVGPPLQQPDEANAVFERRINMAPIAAALDPPPVDVLGYGPIGEELESGQLGLSWGVAHVFADPPDKLLSDSAATAFKTSVTKNVVMRIWEAESDLVITSPYLIPGKHGMKTLRDLAAKGVKATIVTNSLAATDEPLVHNGYAKYRPEILAAGVDLLRISTSHSLRCSINFEDEYEETKHNRYVVRIRGIGRYCYRWRIYNGF